MALKNSYSYDQSRQTKNYFLASYIYDIKNQDSFNPCYSPETIRAKSLLVELIGEQDTDKFIENSNLKLKLHQGKIFNKR